MKKQVEYFIEDEDLSFLMTLKNKSSSLNKINKKNKNKKENLFYKKKYKNE